MEGITDLVRAAHPARMLCKGGRVKCAFCLGSGEARYYGKCGDCNGKGSKVLVTLTGERVEVSQILSLISKGGY